MKIKLYTLEMTNTFKWITPSKKYPAFNSFNKEPFHPMFYKYIYLSLLTIIMLLMIYYFNLVI